MFAIKEAEECVIDEYLCLTGGATLHPSACPKKLHNIFSNLLLKLTFNLQAGRKKRKNRQCGLCLELMFSGEHYNQLLPSQTSFSNPM